MAGIAQLATDWKKPDTLSQGSLSEARPISSKINSRTTLAPIRIIEINASSRAFGVRVQSTQKTTSTVSTSACSGPTSPLL